MIERTRNLIEPAGASPLAAAVKLRDAARRPALALVASGGNVSPTSCARCWRAERYAALASKAPTAWVSSAMAKGFWMKALVSPVSSLKSLGWPDM